MQQVTVDGARWQQDSDGAWLALRVKSPQTAMDVCDAMKTGKEYNVTIKGKGRSLDANAYCWVLLDRLAANYGVARERVYRQEIQSIGGVSEVLCLREKAAEAFCRSWERNGIGWMNMHGILWLIFGMFLQGRTTSGNTYPTVEKIFQSA